MSRLPSLVSRLALLPDAAYGARAAGIHDSATLTSIRGNGSKRGRGKSVSDFYNQPEIDRKAAMRATRLTTTTLMNTGATTSKGFNVLAAEFLRKELPIRLAHRIAEIRALPFIVGCNPQIQTVHDLYIHAFHQLNDLSPVTNAEDEEEFAEVLREFLDQHKDVISMLARGFKECRKHIKDEEIVRTYLDRNMASRLAVRMLCMQQICLRDKRPGYVGMINMKFNLREHIQKVAKSVCDIAAADTYGAARVPEVVVDGHANATFPYIEMPLDYILPELLKNAVRAVAEHHDPGWSTPFTDATRVPPVRVTIATNDRDFVIRVSDRGGGIPHDRVDRVMDYNYTTAEESTERLMDRDIFSNMMQVSNRSTAGPMHGYGFGLPVSRAYAEYMGGSLTFSTMQGLGTDFYLRLKHFRQGAHEDTKHELRI